MGTIATTFSIKDEMSSVLDAINSKVKNLIGNFYNLQNATSNFYINFDSEKALDDIGALQDIIKETVFDIPIKINDIDALDSIEGLKKKTKTLKKIIEPINEPIAMEIKINGLVDVKNDAQKTVSALGEIKDGITKIEEAAKSMEASVNIVSNDSQLKILAEMEQIADKKKAIAAKPIFDKLSTEALNLHDKIGKIDDKISEVKESVKSMTFKEAEKSAAFLKKEIEKVFAGVEKVKEKFDLVSTKLAVSQIEEMQGNLGSVVDEAINLQDELNGIEMPTKEVMDTKDEVERTTRSARETESAFSRWGAAIVVANNALSLIQKGMNAIRQLATNTVGYVREELAINLRVQRAIISNVDSLQAAQREYYRIFDAARVLSREIGVAESALRAGVGELIRYTGNIDLAVESMSLLADMAMAQSKNLQVTNKDMEQMASMMGRVAQLGNVNLLGRLGINIQGIDQELFKISNEAERMSIIIQAAEQDFGGFAAAVAQTPIGAINKATNAFDDLRQQIGDSAIAFKGTFANAVLTFMPKISTAIERVIEFIGNNFVEVISVVGLAVSALTVKVGVLAAAKLVAFAKPMAIVGAFIGLMKSLGFSFQDIFAIAFGVFTGIAEVAQKVLGFVKTVLSNVFDSIAQAANLIVEGISGLFQNFGESASEPFIKLKDVVFTVLELILDAVATKINFMVNPFVDFGNFIANVFTHPVASIIQLFSNMADRVLGMFESMLNGISRLLNLIPGVNVDVGGTIANVRASLANATERAVYRHTGGEGLNEVFQSINLTGADILNGFRSAADTFMGGFRNGVERGNTMIDRLGDTFAGMNDFDSNAFGAGMNAFGGSFDNPFSFTPDGALKTANQNDISIRGENLRFLLDAATRRYAQEYRQQAHITVNIPGMVIKEEADADKFIDKFIRQLESAYAANAAIG